MLKISLEESPVNFIACKRAQELLRLGLNALGRGNFEEAREHFRRSAAEQPTADALTCWAGIEHQLGNTLLAILLCHRAILIDPDYGKSYNDIGAYLVTLGRLDESIPWFERAAIAKHYEPRESAYFNLGRVYLAKSMLRKALGEFRKALEIAPYSPELRGIVTQVQQSLQ